MLTSCAAAIGAQASSDLAWSIIGTTGSTTSFLTEVMKVSHFNSPLLQAPVAGAMDPECWEDSLPGPVSKQPKKDKHL